MSELQTRVIWAYPAHVLAGLPKITPEQREVERRDLHARLEATKARIGASIKADKELHAERVAALAWCRANGNPHKPKDTNHDQ